MFETFINKKIITAILIILVALFTVLNLPTAKEITCNVASVLAVNIDECNNGTVQ